MGVAYYTRLVSMPDYELPTSIVVKLGDQELAAVSAMVGITIYNKKVTQ